MPDPESPGEWVDNKTDYYRYYKPGEPNGYEHGLKYVVSPEGTELLGSNYETASNEDVARRASHYFEYDPPSRRVNLVRTAGGEDAFEITYSENEDLEFVHFNHWALRADMKTADSAQKTVYSNHIGQDLLIDLCSEADDSNCVHWISHRKFNDNARVIEEYSPTTVVGYNQDADNLNVTLQPDKGLVRIYDYYANTDLDKGQIEGYLEAEFVQCGANPEEPEPPAPPANVRIRDYEYDQHLDDVDGSTISVFQVSRLTDYSRMTRPVVPPQRFSLHIMTTQASCI